MPPRSCCILLFTLQKACYTRSVCLSPRSVVSCCLPCRRLVTRVACVCPREAVVSCCLPCRRLVTRVACVLSPRSVVHSCKCCFCCFPSSAGDKGEGEMARAFPIVWRISFSRRRGRVVRGKPQGFALPLTQGGWQGQRLVQTWLQEPWLQADGLLLVGP